MDTVQRPHVDHDPVTSLRLTEWLVAVTAGATVRIAGRNAALRMLDHSRPLTSTSIYRVQFG